jgi:hypothetical protein
MMNHVPGDQNEHFPIIKNLGAEKNVFHPSEQKDVVIK